MANTITISPLGRVSPAARQAGVVPLSILTTETYATPTGITIDFATLLSVELKQHGIAHADIIGIIGGLTTGHRGEFTKTATAAQFTVRFWNGATEIADGALNHTIKCFLVFSAGAAS